jgi:endoglucanase
LECLKHFAERYANNKRVVAVDLRNEIRSTPQYDPTWGDGNVLTDWRRAAILAAKEIQSVTPDVLIMIGGLNFQLDLTGIKFAPIGPHELKVQNKLVYTGHFYGFSWPIIMWKLWSY